MKQKLQHFTDKPIYIIGDGHDLEHYQTKKENTHSQRAKEVVWFGYAENAYVLEPLIPIIKSHGLKLKVICQRPLPFGQYIKWNLKTYIREISKADFAVLPLNGNLKSNNKDITALLSGIPVAKNARDIERLIDPKERRKDMEKAKGIGQLYNAKRRAEKYLSIIDEITTQKINTSPIKVYTAICGKYETPRKDITVFSDKPSDKFKDPVMNAKIYKVLPHKFLKCDISIWIDGNIFLKVDPQRLIDEYLKDADIAVFRHPYRNCAYQEHPHARHRLKPCYYALIDEQVKDYMQEGFPHRFKLAECGVIIRRHSQLVEEFNERWWTEITRYSNRDQMSFPYVWWKMKEHIKINLIKGNVRNHPHFTYNNH